MPKLTSRSHEYPEIQCITPNSNSKILYHIEGPIRCLCSGLRMERFYPCSRVLSGVPSTSAVFLITSVPHQAGNSISGNVNIWNKLLVIPITYEKNEDSADCKSNVQSRREHVIVFCPPTRPSPFNVEIENETTLAEFPDRSVLYNGPRNVIHWSRWWNHTQTYC